MRLIQCDGCQSIIDPAASYFGADEFLAAQLVDEDDPDGPTFLTELKTIGENEFHFCSPACLSSWAFSRQLDGLPTT